MNQINFKRDDEVYHPRFGPGVVKNVDAKTYSIVMVTVDYGRSEIVRPASELSMLQDVPAYRKEESVA